MLREAVNLSPDAKLRPAIASHADADADNGTDSEADTTAVPAHSCYMGQHESQGTEEDHWQAQQGQEAGRSTALLREAYKEMLLQQQSRHKTELETRQAKHQKQLCAQVQQLYSSSSKNNYPQWRNNRNIKVSFCFIVL